MKTMKRLVLALILVLGVVILFGNKQVAAETPEQISVDIHAEVEGVKDLTPLYTGATDYGQSFNVDASTHGDDEFAFWVVNGIVEKDRPANTNFVATNDFKAYAVFTEGTNKAVVFIDSNGKLIETQFVADVLLAEEPEDLPNKIGFDHDGWNTVEHNGHELRTLQYVRNNDSVITVNGEEYGYNDIVTLTLPEGHTHWLDEEENVVSYKHEYKLSALEDRTFTSAAGGEPTNLVTLRTLSDYRSGHTTFLGQVDLVDDLVEFGLEVDGVFRPTPIINPETNEFLISIPGNMPEGVVVRAYVVVRQGTDLVTVFDRELRVPDFSGEYTMSLSGYENDTLFNIDMLDNNANNILTVIASKNSATTNPRTWGNGTEIRMYNGSGNGNKIHFEVTKEGYRISKVEMTFKKGRDNATISSGTHTFTGSEFVYDQSIHGLDDQEFIIHITGNDQMHFTSLKITIESIIPLTDLEKVDLDYESLLLGLAEGDTAEAITKNITLPTLGTSGSDITWDSNNQDIISNIGIVSRTDSYEEVTLTATITAGEHTRIKEFIVIVAIAGLEDFNLAVEELTVGFVGQNDNLEGVTENLILPTSLHGTTITWVSSDTSIINNNGEIVERPEVATDVEMTATISLGSITSQDKTIIVTVLPEGEEPSMPEQETIIDFTSTGKGNLPAGWTYSGLGNDYTGSRLRFDNTGDTMTTNSLGLEAMTVIYIEINDSFLNTGGGAGNGILEIRSGTIKLGEINITATSATSPAGSVTFTLDQNVDKLTFYFNKSTGNLALGKIKVITNPN